MACLEIPSEVVLRKTKMCKFYAKGTCEKGSACNFAHSRSLLQSRPDLYKTNLCMALERTGTCRDGSSCKYAHGQHELRGKASQEVHAALPSNAEPQAVYPEQQVRFASHMVSINIALPVGQCAVPAFASLVAVSMVPGQLGGNENATAIGSLPVIFHVIAESPQMQPACVKNGAGNGGMFESESSMSRQITPCSTMFELEACPNRQITSCSTMLESDACPSRQITSGSTMFKLDACPQRQMTSGSVLFDSEACPGRQIRTCSNKVESESCPSRQSTDGIFLFDTEPCTRSDSHQSTTCSSTRSHSVDSLQTAESTPQPSTVVFKRVAMETVISGAPAKTSKAKKFVSNGSTDSTLSAASVADKALRKTKMCRYYPKGMCSMGDACNFAHEERGLQAKPNLFRSQLCFAFQRNGICREGAKCKYAHGPEQLCTYLGGEEKCDISDGAKHSNGTMQTKLLPALPQINVSLPRLPPVSSVPRARTIPIALATEPEEVTVKNTFIHDFDTPQLTSQRRSSSANGRLNGN